MDNYDLYEDCPCGCGDCSTCDLDCGENGQKCPDGQCLGEKSKTDNSDKVST